MLREGLCAVGCVWRGRRRSRSDGWALRSADAAAAFASVGCGRLRASVAGEGRAAAALREVLMMEFGRVVSRVVWREVLTVVVRMVLMRVSRGVAPR